jgi:hypothetical protein
MLLELPAFSLMCLPIASRLIILLIRLKELSARYFLRMSIKLL